MYSALYYPHTKIRNESMLKSSLLLWDEIHTIVPWPGYRIEDGPNGERKAFDLVGKTLCPSEQEKERLHSLVEDFIQRPLPPAFYLRAHSADREVYELFKHKILHKTWDLLQGSGMAQPIRRRSSHYATPAPTGLVLMSLLADCCAGDSLVRVTDRSETYAGLAGLFIDNDMLKSDEPVQSLFADASRSEAELSITQIALDIIDPRQFSLDSLIALRLEEHRESGYRLRKLRHRLSDHLRKQAAVMTSGMSERDKEIAKAELKQSMEDDYKELKDAMKLQALISLSTTQVISAAAMIGTALTIREALPATVWTHLGELVTVTSGAISVASQFAQSRRKLLLDNPTAYLLEISNSR
jgi:hypothetical protein